MQVFSLFTTVLSAILSGLYDLAISFQKSTAIVRLNAELYHDKEVLECKAKAKEFRQQLIDEGLLNEDDVLPSEVEMDKASKPKSTKRKSS